MRTRLLITDALGSVLAQIKPDGSQAASYVYSPYGQTRVSVAGGELSLGGASLNATEANASLYTAREYEGTNLGTVAPGANQNAQTASQGELYYYRARYYDPVLKRFISEDPIGLEGGMNVYSYVNGSPLMFMDPEGLDPISDRVAGIPYGRPGDTYRNPFSNPTCMEKCLAKYGVIAAGKAAAFEGAAAGAAASGSFAIAATWVLFNKTFPYLMPLSDFGVYLDCKRRCDPACLDERDTAFHGAP